MGLICRLFGHKWNGCICIRCKQERNEGHNWNLCIGYCRICGLHQPEQHDWNGCKCSRCGLTRDIEHSWENCKCKICGKLKDESFDGHIWAGCKCEVCGLTRNINHESHEWEGCKCKVCGKTRDSVHDYFIEYIYIGKTNRNFHGTITSDKGESVYLRCRNCSYNRSVNLSRGKYYCSKCLSMVEWKYIDTGESTLITKEFICPECGNNGSYDYSDSY